MKNLMLIILFISSFNISSGQDNCLPIEKMKNKGYFMPKNNRDTIYDCVLRNDSIIEIERIYTLVERKIYFSFINDSVVEFGRFRRFNTIQFLKSRFIKMEKRKYWKLFDTKGRLISIIDNYSQYEYKYIRLFPYGRLGFRK